MHFSGQLMNLFTLWKTIGIEKLYFDKSFSEMSIPSDPDRKDISITIISLILISIISVCF